jgi:diacylglycerol O-acyltransferase / wax synthase
MDAFMRESDAFSWHMERDPVLRSTVVAIVWLDRSPDWEAFAARAEWATGQVPSFRRRVVEPLGRLAPPRWTEDEAFDMSWHVRHMEAPPPHDARAVVDFARAEAMTAFDSARPLWQFTLVEHVDGDRAALVMKLHHSLTDGLGGMQLAMLLFDQEPDGSAHVSAENGHQHPDVRHLSTPELIMGSLAHDGRQLADRLGGLAAAALPVAFYTARHPLASAGGALNALASLGRTVAPVRETLSPVMRERGLSRHLDEVEVQLADLKRAAKAANGSVNDGFMAAVTGGLQRYHERHDKQIGRLRVTLPISIRTPTDPLGGNRITLIRFPVPVAEPDPAARVRQMRRACLAARAERSLAYTDGIAGTLNLLPSGFIGSMLKHVDFLASDVPGLPFPVYLAGVRVRRYVAFGPTIGSAVNLTLLSYAGACAVGLNIDSSAVPDPDLFVECIRGGFDEVLGLAGSFEPARLPLRETKSVA